MKWMVVFGALMLALGLGQSASARDAKWSGAGSDGMGYAVDCSGEECAEDEYITLVCNVDQKGVSLELQGILPPEGAKEGDALQGVFDVDGKKRSLDGTVGFSEMFGEMPVFEVSRTDPLIGSFKSGRILKVTLLGGDSIEIPLTGAASAVDAMLNAC